MSVELKDGYGKPTFYATIASSPEWQAWEKAALGHGFDWHESTECGWLSPEHFAAFMSWVRNSK